MAIEYPRKPGNSRLPVPILALGQTAVALYQALLDMHATSIYFMHTVKAWVFDIAPILIQAHASQVLRDVIRAFPLISAPAREEILGWMLEAGL